jgi:hypothetical protein
MRDGWVLKRTLKDGSVVYVSEGREKWSPHGEKAIKFSGKWAAVVAQRAIEGWEDIELEVVFCKG